MQTEERYLRVYCLTHGVSFTALGTNSVVCASGGEALAQNFPQEEFWEYCCDCQNFWPSSLAKGGKVQERCPVCSRTCAKRYVCDHCKVICLDSSEESKRKVFSIKGAGGVEPTCPGCLQSTMGTVRQHQCDEINAEFYTARDVCPFCHDSLVHTSRQAEKTLYLDPSSSMGAVPGNAVDAGKEWDGQSACPQCGKLCYPWHRFCQQCGYSFAEDSRSPGRSSDATLPLPPPAVRAVPRGGTPPAINPGPIYYGGAATDAGNNYTSTETASTTSATKPLLIVALALALIMIGVLAVLLLQANRRTGVESGNSTNITTASTSPSPGATSRASNQNARPTTTPYAQSTANTNQGGPTANARLAYCRSNNVYVRSSPYLDETKRNVIKVINRDQKLWALSTSTNYDTAYIRSAGGNVTDNWTEVQLYDDASVRGWVFSYFVQY